MTRRPAAARVAALAALAAASALAACGRGDSRDGVPNPAAEAPGAGAAALNPDPAANTFAPKLGVDLTKFRKTASGLYVRDDTVGTGATAATGREARVAYTGWLADGTEFDASRGRPFVFVPGQTPVIAAWDEAVPGMRVGGVRTIVAPAALGYGAGGVPGIPGNAVLVFRMELVGVR
jgi:peptidylprolyl isomerase